MDWADYRSEAERVWARHRPRTWILHLVPWPWSGRTWARAVASRLQAVVDDIAALEPPHQERLNVERHYLEPLRRAAKSAADTAEDIGLRTSMVEAVLKQSESIAPLYSDADHGFVVEHGLPQWWLPKSDAWGPRPIG